MTSSLKIPGKATISNRTSTIASQFARSRAPYIVPTANELAARCRLLGIDLARPTCTYCGGPPTEWDHLMPMVTASGWTGYFTEIANLVPACGKCNQSRGAKPVADWMRSKARWSPRMILQSRDGSSEAAALAEIERRIALVATALERQPPRRLTLSDDPIEAELEACRIELNALLHRAERLSAQLRQRYHAQLTTAPLPASQHLR